MRLIDADELNKKVSAIVEKNNLDYKTYAVIEQIITAPTVDAKPVKHGLDLSELLPDSRYYFVCSVCGATTYDVAYGYLDGACFFNYCPACGAKIDNARRPTPDWSKWDEDKLGGKRDQWGGNTGIPIAGLRKAMERGRNENIRGLLAEAIARLEKLNRNKPEDNT